MGEDRSVTEGGLGPKTEKVKMCEPCQKEVFLLEAPKARVCQLCSRKSKEAKTLLQGSREQGLNDKKSVLFFVELDIEVQASETHEKHGLL